MDDMHTLYHPLEHDPPERRGIFSRLNCWLSGGHEWTRISWKRTGGWCWVISGVRPQYELVERCHKCGEERKPTWVSAADPVKPLTAEMARRCLETEFK